MPVSSNRQFAALIAVLLLLSACAPAPERPEAKPEPTFSSEQAELAYAEGDYLKAADIYSRLATGSSGSLRALHLFHSAEALFHAGQREAAKRQLDHMVGPFPPRLAMQRQLLRAAIVIEDGPEWALNLLLTPAAGNEAGDDLYTELHRLRADAYGRMGHHLESAREYTYRERYLVDEEVIRVNHQAIWDKLSLLSDRVLQQLSVGPPDQLSGWMDLVRISRNYRQQPEQLQDALSNWKRSYPRHPAEEQFVLDVNRRLVELIQKPQRLALLLPLSGKFAPAGRAVLDGVMAAYYHDPSGIELKVYDSGGNPNDIDLLYQQAVDEGAQLVIGPLNKDAVARLAYQVDLPVPLLALNYAGHSLSPAMYQFALAPEEEAVQVAERARYEGRHRAALVIPKGEWGERVEAAFSSHWQQLGGEVVSAAYYDSNASDFSQPLKTMLNLDQSQQRKQRISRMFTERLEFTPRRRQDIDFIFIAAFSQQARLLKPQLRFHHAADLPVYATSHVFGGVVDRAKDRDMEELAFGAMPWTLDADTPNSALRKSNKEQLLRHSGPLQRLVALGVDAYHMASLLKLLEAYPNERFEGETGKLGIDAQRRINRELLWATFKNGVPRLQEIPRTPPSSAETM